MTSFKHISVRTKISLVMSAAVSLIVVVGFFSLVQLRMVNEVAEEIRDGWLPRLEMLGELKRAVDHHYQLATRQLQTTNFRHLAEIAKGTKATKKAISSVSVSYRQIIAAPEERHLFTEFKTLWDRYLKTDKEVFSRLEVGDVNKALVSFNTVSREAFDKATARLDDLSTYAKQKSRESTAYARYIYGRALFLVIAATLIASFCALGAIAWSDRQVTTPILHVANAMRRLTDGDLDLAVHNEDNRRDEIGTLIASVTSYRNSLKRGQELSAVAELEHQRLHSAVTNMPVGLCMFDADQRVVVANARYAEMYGLELKHIRPGTTLREILEERVTHGCYDNIEASEFIEASVADFHREVTEILHLADGRFLSVLRRKTGDGGMVSTHEDITERRLAEARIAHLAHHDALTDLPNRALLRERLEQAKATMHKGGKPFAIILLDLDRFKEVNDTLGHPIGDELLKTVAQRLLGCVEEGDTVARLGGDEFAIIQISSNPETESIALASKIQKELSNPFDIGGHLVLGGTSMGISIAPNDGEESDQLLKNADLALYRAKNDGRGTFHLFEPEMDRRMQERRRLESDLRYALAKGQLAVHYQPLVNIERDEICGFEALLRWQHPERGNIEPDEFIPLAEETGLIIPIGEWVLRKACSEAATWPDHLKVAVNISPVQFKKCKLADMVMLILTETGMAPRRLELEITESAMMENPASAFIELTKLHNHCVRIALDDFGTGYSSLSNLRKFPFDKIKIDRSFVSDLSIANIDALAVVRSVAQLGASLGMSTTAEGVETKEQSDQVRLEGCTEMQGFYICPPSPATDIARLIQAKCNKSVSAA